MKKLLPILFLLIATPAWSSTFGKTDIGGNSLSHDADSPSVTKAVLPDNNASVSKITLYASSSGTAHVKTFILADSSSHPTGNPVCSSGAVTIGTLGWYDFTLSGCTLSSGTYWIGFVTDNVSVVEYYADAAGYNYWALKTGTYNDPSTIDGSLLDQARDRQFSIYATYTTGTPVCDSSHCSLCLTSGDCTTASCYWYNSTCNSTPQPTPKTYYVRNDGGTATQCTGLVDAAYSSGTGQPCAFNHISWATGAYNGAAAMIGGDTVIIDGIDHVGSGQAKYKVGYGMPNSSCSMDYPYSCMLLAIPSGSDSSHPTKILGKTYDSGCTNPPQLYGTEAVTEILNLTAANYIDIECLEITDHAACGAGMGHTVCPTNYPSDVGDWGGTGIYALGGSNWTLKNLNIHGMAARGIKAGGLSAITVQNVNTDGNYMSGWDFDVGESGSESYNSGSLIFNTLKVRFNGCMEAYPLASQTYSASNYSWCYDQNDSGYGDGIGTYQTGGDWQFINSDISHNTQDGLDLLYHRGANSIKISRSRFEGNNGAQIKIGDPYNVSIENSIIIGDCGYFITSGISHGPGFSPCRANGTVLPVGYYTTQNSSYKLLNSSVWSDGDTILYSGGSACNGNQTITSTNNAIFGALRYDGEGENTSYYYCGGSDGNGAGACCNGGTAVALTTTYNDVWQTKDAPISGTGNLNVNPYWGQGTTINTDLGIEKYNVYLTSSSTSLVGAANSGISLFNGSNDYNNFSRGASWDIGALEYGSVPGSTTYFNNVIFKNVYLR